MTQPFDNRDWDARQIEQKNAEIEAMKLIHTELIRQIKDAEEAIQRQDNVIIEQKALLTRAAEMLETLGCKGPAVEELRKAAE